MERAAEDRPFQRRKFLGALCCAGKRELESSLGTPEIPTSLSTRPLCYRGATWASRFRRGVVARRQ